LSEYNII